MERTSCRWRACLECHLRAHRGSDLSVGWTDAHRARGSTTAPRGIAAARRSTVSLSRIGHAFLHGGSGRAFAAGSVDHKQRRGHRRSSSERPAGPGLRSRLALESRAMSRRRRWNGHRSTGKHRDYPSTARRRRGQILAARIRHRPRDQRLRSSIVDLAGAHQRHLTTGAGRFTYSLYSDQRPQSLSERWFAYLLP